LKWLGPVAVAVPPPAQPVARPTGAGTTEGVVEAAESVLAEWTTVQVSALRFFREPVQKAGSEIKMKTWSAILETLDRSPGASNEALRNLLAHTKGKLPSQYIQLLRLANGASGRLEKGFLQIWAAEEVLLLNQGYAVDEFVPGIFLFGSNGGTTGYGLDLGQPVPVVELPLIGMSLETIRVRASSIGEFLIQLS
jgi:hypothetical protein